MELRDDLRAVHDRLRASLERAARTAQGKRGVLRVGMLPSNACDLRRLWDPFRARHPQWDLHLRHNPFINAFEPLRHRDIDVLVAWLPIEEPDLTVGPIVFTEPKVLLVAPDHPLVGGSSASVETLADHGVCRGTVPLPGYWEDAFTPFSTPSGRPIERVDPPISNLDEMLTVVGTGQAVHNLGAHVTRYHARPDIVYLPIHDAPMLQWALVWRTDAENDLVRAFAQVVRDLGPIPL